VNELALFAGAGGGILGGHLLGWRTVCAVERDAYAAQILAQRQNDGILRPFPIWSDVTTFDGKPWKGIVDVISGGFPCQDISSAGKGAGIEGERSGLWKEMARIICEVGPGFVFVENSPMLTSRGLGDVLGDLASLGFDAEWGVLSAADVGANHSRARLWILAYSKRMPEWTESRSRQARRMGRQLKYVAWDGDWEGKLSSLRGMGNGLARAVDRTNTIRNGQVPRVAATAFNLLRERAGW
jgi:DNA (cytosine-5)-methyltransferase 1